MDYFYLITVNKKHMVLVCKRNAFVRRFYPRRFFYTSKHMFDKKTLIIIISCHYIFYLNLPIIKKIQYFKI